MKIKDRSSVSESRPGRGVLPWIVVGAVILGIFAIMPGAWALPEQAPDFQTVPTLTPTPTDRAATPTPPRVTATPGQPTDTPAPGATPTDTPAALTPTAVPQTATPLAGTPTAAASASPIASATATQVTVTPVPVGLGDCWTVPTPGFEPVQVESLKFEATSDQGLVVPGQVLTLRLTATNLGDDVVENVLICNPLDPALQRGTPTSTQGEASLVAQGLVVDVGDLLPAISATAELTLTIPIDFPLGGVIEDQAWLFAESQQVSTSLLTWALPPAYLPPTGK